MYYFFVTKQIINIIIYDKLCMYNIYLIIILLSEPEPRAKDVFIRTE